MGAPITLEKRDAMHKVNKIDIDKWVSGKSPGLARLVDSWPVWSDYKLVSDGSSCRIIGYREQDLSLAITVMREGQEPIDSIGHFPREIAHAIPEMSH